MQQADAYYRAFLAYRAAVSEQRECLRDRNAMTEAGGSGELSVTRMVCTVDEAWINAIEAGLIHVEKAIKEERQFIYSNGEVIPIEKVKQVSKDSVEHLARHAELISRATEGEMLIPDELYTVERLSDYAVYENRFLYMLLCYLRDFVTIRYRRILELTNRYAGALTAESTVETYGRRLSVKLALSEERQDDPCLRARNTVKDLLDRMDLILKTVTAFLATPLMESAGKAALLKPPITKTNVLKMDNNFKGAMALYEYIIAYEGDGYTVTEDIQSLDPFAEAGEDMAELALLTSHLTHRYGLGLTDELKLAYERDEEARRLVELSRQAELVEALRRRWADDPAGREDYILALEKQTRSLSREVERLSPLYRELDERKMTEAELRVTLHELEARLDAYADAEAYTTRICEAAVEEAEVGFRRERELYMQKCAEDARILRQDYDAQIDAVAKEALAQREKHAEEMQALQEILARRQIEVSRLTEALDEADEARRALEARLLGQRAIAGEVSTEDMEGMTDEGSFDELERQLDAFVRLYRRVWGRTKRRIRKDLINLKKIKGQGASSADKS